MGTKDGCGIGLFEIQIILKRGIIVGGLQHSSERQLKSSDAFRGSLQPKDARNPQNFSLRAKKGNIVAHIQ
jgi:hypothetical protein